MLAPLPAAVNAPKEGGRRVDEVCDKRAFITERRFGFKNVPSPVGDKAEHGLQFVALPLSFFFVRGDPVRTFGFNGLDAVEVVHARVARKLSVTVFTSYSEDIAGVVQVQVTVAALGAHNGASGGKAGTNTYLISRAGVELGLDHAIDAPVVVNEASRAELGNTQETGPADHAA